MTTSTADTLIELRRKQQAVWSSGDYNKIAALTVPVSEDLVSHVGIRPGHTVLDVATGTGHVALAAARRSAEVTGIDYVPALLDIARRRAAAESLAVDFVEAPAEQLPFDDGTFDVVLSAIGVMFCADHDRAASELVRVCRPGGRVALANWTADGFVGGMLRIVGQHVDPPAGAQSPLRWSDEATVASLLGDRVSDLRVENRSVVQRFASAEAFADLFLAYYGPTHTAAKRLSPAGRQALRADLVAHARAANQADAAGLTTPWAYRIITATKAVD
jgi:SAM-dependent methyltransferase